MVRIRIEQTSPKLGRVEDNLRDHGKALEKASAEGVDLLVFPELSLTGYLLKDLVPDVALTLDDLVSRLEEASGGGIRNLEAVLGFAEESPGRRFFNSTVFLRWDEAGKIEPVHTHRKCHLPTYGLFDEGRYYSTGLTVRSFETASVGRCGMLVCEDAWRLSLPFLLALDGPDFEGIDTLIVPSNSPARGVEAAASGVPTSHQTWENMLHAYASLLGILVIYANRAGVEDGLTFTGGSRVLGPAGDSLSEGSLFEAESLEAEVDFPEIVRKSRIRTPFHAAEEVFLLRNELDRISRRGN